MCFSLAGKLVGLGSWSHWTCQWWKRYLQAQKREILSSLCKAKDFFQDTRPQHVACGSVAGQGSTDRPEKESFVCSHAVGYDFTCFLFPWVSWKVAQGLASRISNQRLSVSKSRRPIRLSSLTTCWPLHFPRAPVICNCLKHILIFAWSRYSRRWMHSK